MAVNKDLADVLGNLLSRVVRFVHRYHDGSVPTLGPAGRGAREAELIEELAAHEAEFDRAIERFEFVPAIRKLREAWALGNKYLDDREPWSLRKTDIEECATVMNTATHFLRRIAVLSSPVIPHTARQVLAALGLESLDPEQALAGDFGFDDLVGQALPPGPKPLIEKVEDERVAELRARFGGGAGG